MEMVDVALFQGRFVPIKSLLNSVFIDPTYNFVVSTMARNRLTHVQRVLDNVSFTHV